ncbi:MAG TPA: hypothetical protein VGO47_14430 [Chlamydiales bacterium]|jgi:hypothetical protein|nr:hypothetical protein [Chlamydiales bacterium]
MQIIQSMESSPDILIQLQEIIVPVVNFTLEIWCLVRASPSNYYSLFMIFDCWPMADLLSTAYEIVDTLTFNLRRIAPSMWSAYETTYKIFKADAIDFLEGKPTTSCTPVCAELGGLYRHVTVLKQLHHLWQRRFPEQA